MKILVVGDRVFFEECRLKFPNNDLRHVESHAEVASLISHIDVVFDFVIDRHPEQFQMYASRSVVVFLNTTMLTLASLEHDFTGPVRCTAFGFNGFPTLFNRECLELSILRNSDITQLEKLCKELNTEYLVVDDRVGLVTPRVICMIINEAYYAVEERTATREDIDLAMKLGTNYPYGPFEWCRKIGLKYVYELLNALHDDTKDERYKVSALMKKEYLGIRQ